MYGGTRVLRVRIQKVTTLLLLCGYALGFFDPFLPFLKESADHAQAAQVTIDANAATNGSSHTQSGGQIVFVSDQVGYKFFRDAPGYCVYRKTTDGGSTWSATTTVDSQADCIQIQVWYDKWTPGSASSSIHIVTLDTGNDDVWYNRLDTNGDTLLLGSSPVSTFTGSAQGGTSIVEGENFTSITRATNGTIYVVSNDGTNVRDSAVLECTTSCNLASNWTETTPLPLDDASDQNILVPLTSGNIMIIQRDFSADDIRSRVWNDGSSSWDGAWTTIDANATENTTYDVAMSAAVSSTTPGFVYLAYLANVSALGTDDQVRTARFNGTSWATSSNATSSTARGLTEVALSIDSANDDVYVAYSARTTPGTANTANLFWRKATSSMMNWETENGPINSTADDFFGLDMSRANDERLYLSWFDNTDDDIFGDTIADIFPGVRATTTGSQISTTTASTSNIYIGGAFVLYNTYRNRSYDVTGLTITEGGTIDGSSALSNVRILYEMDTTAPYNCASVSYDGTESQFGSTDTNGFSGANGVSSFSGTTVTLSTTTAMCAYVVLDVLDAASPSSTIDISINDIASDITVTDGSAGPSGGVNIPGTTFVHNDAPTQTHFHWRNDDNSESLATSRTSGSEDTALSALQQGSTARLRLQVSNEGSTTTGPMQYRLEYGSTTGSCAETSTWVNVGDAGGEFDMYDSSNLTDGADTTNIAVASGGVTDENATFVTTNGAVKDTSSQTGNITLTPSEFVELEYAFVASSSAAEGNTYCFRVTNAGNPLTTYSQLARANIAADVLVTASGTQIASTNLPATNFNVGGQFVVVDNTGSRNVTGITIKENGTVDGQTDLDNIRLYYDLDTSNPYDCSSESYSGSESQFGSTDTDGFSSANGTSTFTGSVGISTTQAMCLYTVLDTTSTAQNGETIDIVMESPSTNFVVSSGSVSPSVTRDITGSTTLAGPVLTQSHYHFRNDNGTEAAATSMTGGAEDTAVTNVAETTPVRLRLELSNEGGVAAPSQTYRLEYGAKISTCSAIASWTDVGGAGGDWDMFNSSNLTEGADTTNIAVASGGVTDENTTFVTPNGAVKDTSSVISALTLATTEFLEAEFSIQQTSQAGRDQAYCFRLTQNGNALDTYTVYPELTTSPERDFEIQRGTVTVSGTSTTLVAGVNYVAPSASTSAFIRITNTAHTGAGSTLTGTQNADDVTAYILNPSNILTSVTIARPSTAINNTRVSWEIVEFIGTPGSDNEMIVRSQSAVTYGTSNLFATGTTVGTVNDDADVVVFVTGQLNPDTGTANYNSGQSVSTWHAGSDVPVFERGITGSDASIVSYAVVEFTGQNWQIQRSEHTYTSAGTTETESITAVGSLARTFVHAQKLNGTFATGTDEYGHEVWLSSVGFVSYFLESGASVPSGQRSVAWVIENVQTSSGAMDVTRPPQGSSNGGAEPLTVSVSITKTLSDITNASIFGTSRSAGTGLLYPRPIAGLTIASTTHYEVWRSDTGANLTFRVEIVEWPTAGLALRQNYYRFYVDNNALDPTDPWPAGGADLGENTVLSASDEPLGEGERLRIRMSLSVVNATFPTSTKAFRLQYAPLTTTCSAISEATWATLGDSASSTVWRGYNATGTTDGTALGGNPPTAGDLNLSVAQQAIDVAGTLEESNDTAANPYSVPEGGDIEYDWIVEQNGANAETFYCFRMIESDGTPLAAYLQYPQVRTASFTPKTQNWRWFDDENSLTPTTSLAAINAAPTNIANNQIVVLRITVKETKNIARNDVRFKLQYSEYANFSTSTDVLATTSCLASTSTWCYANASGTDNAIVASTTLNDVDSCVAGVGDGCGTYNEDPSYRTGFRHENGAASEYSFALQSKYPRVNTVYYFRLYDLVQNVPVSVNTGESYPSLVTEGASLTFTSNPVASSTVTEGITTDIGATATSVPFGRLTIGNEYEAAQRFSVTTNSPEGYQLYMVTSSDLMSASGDIFTPLTSSNVAPSGWSSGCAVNAPSCFGYHTGDDTLEGGSTRFAANDTYARFSTTTLDEVLYTGGPVTNETVDVVYRIRANSLQPAGQYTTNIRYIAVPVF
jgi:hypothetical protein